MEERRRIADLVALVDRLEGLLERSALSELEVEVAGTTVILRTPAALAPVPSAAASLHAEEGGQHSPAADKPLAAPASHAIVAPLTGVYYRSPSPGAEPYLREGGPVNAGQVIGLIEAMKLFNEIKSDASGRITRVLVENGTLVKRKQPLLEVDPR
jgi:acetyl-CoA carboxylase biotin carboxyl carrier protein